MTLSEIVKNYRKQNKMSMDAFSKKTGVSKAYIGFIESGINPKTKKPIVPSIEMIVKLANAMEMSTDDLVRALDDNYTIEIPANKHALMLSDDLEINIIYSYRQASDPIKKAVNVLLGVDEKDE